MYRSLWGVTAASVTLKITLGPTYPDDLPEFVLEDLDGLPEACMPDLTAAVTAAVRPRKLAHAADPRPTRP